ncbi:MAG: Na/Pi cotransporter family protein [Eubacteriaceae bacterium]|nr:Na/Pi cotransporter family protein [Eubacteriaceae bacterium]
MFIFGINLLSSSLQKTAGKKMKEILGTVSKSQFRGVLFGAVVTSIIQSSTATTVMVVGFVNAGVLALNHIVGIIMGANIGSTTTSWLVASVEWSSFLKPETIGAICSAAGALLLLFSKKENVRNAGEVIVGLGILFLGLSQMPDALAPVSGLDIVRSFFAYMGNNPILGVISGIIVTAIIQSSTASIGILQSMAMSGMIPVSAALYIILGQNIGTCLTALLSSIGTSRNAIAASYVHLVYNILGASAFGAAAIIYFTVINKSYGPVPITSSGISLVHTGYNAFALVLLYPFGQKILSISEWMADKSAGPSLENASLLELEKLDEAVLEAPQIALENSENSIYKLMGLVRANLELGYNAFAKKEFIQISLFWRNANEIDIANDEISEFLKKLYNEDLAPWEFILAASLINCLISIKRISNRSKGFAKLAEDMRDADADYSEAGSNSLHQIYGAAMECYDYMCKAFMYRDKQAIEMTAKRAGQVEQLRERYQAEHRNMASRGGYSVDAGLAFAEAARHFARIAHNINSVAESISSSTVAADDTHEGSGDAGRYVGSGTKNQ